MILLERYQTFCLSIIFVCITINAIYLALKYEKDYMKVIWSLVPIFVPVLGSAIYLIYFQIKEKELKEIN